MAQPNFSLDGISDLMAPTAQWASALTWALARDEVAGRRPPRLTEPDHATWARFKGRLQSPDLLALLFEDAAVTHTLPFDPKRLGQTMRLERLPNETVDTWLAALTQPPAPDDYIAEQAKRLGLPYRMARSDLHVIKPHQRVLELPGTGGQLAHHLVATQDDLTLKDNFTVACATWQERTLAGIIGLDLAAPDSAFAHPIEPDALGQAEHPLRKQTFDFVIGLQPSKGGTFEANDQLAIWYPAAKIVLV